MKKYFYIFIVVVLASSCCTDDCSIENTNDNLCGGQNLGIDELSKLSELHFIHNTQTVDDFSSFRWEWRIYNDTIEVAGKIYNPSIETERHLFFKKNGDCIDYLSSRDVCFDDGGVILDPVTNEVIQSGYTWNNYSDLQFKLQKYRKDKILIGEVSVDGISGTKFWMEFTPDVHRTFPYDYEQYYHN